MRLYFTVDDGQDSSNSSFLKRWCANDSTRERRVAPIQNRPTIQNRPVFTRSFPTVPVPSQPQLPRSLTVSIPKPQLISGAVPVESIWKETQLTPTAPAESNRHQSQSTRSVGAEPVRKKPRLTRFPPQPDFGYFSPIKFPNFNVSEKPQRLSLPVHLTLRPNGNKIVPEVRKKRPIVPEPVITIKDEPMDTQFQTENEINFRDGSISQSRSSIQLNASSTVPSVPPSLRFSPLTGSSTTIQATTAVSSGGTTVNRLSLSVTIPKSFIEDLMLSRGFGKNKSNSLSTDGFQRKSADGNNSNNFCRNIEIT